MWTMAARVKGELSMGQEPRVYGQVENRGILLFVLGVALQILYLSIDPSPSTVSHV